MSNKRDPEATRAAILEAASTLFLDKGFGRVSVSDVARAAGVTKSLIHHHFGSKQDLWGQVKENYFAAFLDNQMQMLEGNEASSELLRKSMIAYFSYLQQKPDFPRLISMLRLEGDHSCSDMDKRITRAGVAKIRQGQDDGYIRNDISAENILIAFLSLVENWFFSRERFCNTCFPETQKDSAQLDQEYLNDIIEIFFTGLRPQQS